MKDSGFGKLTSKALAKLERLLNCGDATVEMQAAMLLLQLGGVIPDPSGCWYPSEKKAAASRAADRAPVG